MKDEEVQILNLYVYISSKSIILLMEWKYSDIRNLTAVLPGEKD